MSATRTTLERVLQEALDKESERATALQEALDATSKRLNALDDQMRAIQAEMVGMMGEHYKAISELQQAHATQVNNLIAGRPADLVPAALPEAPQAIDMAPVIEQMHKAMSVSLSAITNVLEKMDMRVSAMAMELAAMPAPPTELQFDVLDDGAGGNVRIVARAMR